MSHLVLVQGTALHLPLKDASVHCCVTSPPYYGLRSYGIGEGELGIEPTREAYVEAMVQVFREVWRVLRPDGTLWLNLGDVYSSGNRGSFGPLTGKNVAVKVAPRMAQPPDLREKSLLGLPWRVALALQADGWTLRAELIWHKLNPMPESVQDRPTRSHEQVFLFAKQPHYFFDAQAVREPGSPNTHMRFANGGAPRTNGHKWAESHGGSKPNDWALEQVEGHACRSVWPLAAEPFSGSHFATFPTALVRRCLLAGAPTQVCSQCGAPWKREVERGESSWAARKAAGHDSRGYHVGDATSHHAGNPYVGSQAPPGVSTGGLGWVAPKVTTGFSPTCPCNAGTAPSVVLDPFAGSGTTLLVARELGHHAVGIDLSYPYLHDIARERLGLSALARWEGQGFRDAPGVSYEDLPLFGGCDEPPAGRHA